MCGWNQIVYVNHIEQTYAIKGVQTYTHTCVSCLRAIVDVNLLNSQVHIHTQTHTQVRKLETNFNLFLNLESFRKTFRFGQQTLFHAISIFICHKAFVFPLTRLQTKWNDEK